MPIILLSPKALTGAGSAGSSSLIGSGKNSGLPLAGVALGVAGTAGRSSIVLVGSINGSSAGSSKVALQLPYLSEQVARHLRRLN